MLIVPLQPVPSQKIITTLANQTVNLNVYQRRYGMFIDVYVANVLEIGGVICQNLNRIIRDQYLNAEANFAGDFAFFDTQGSEDPVFEGLGDRFQLAWLSPADLATLGMTG